MERSIRELLNLYNPADSLERAWTIPAPWYLDPRIAALEQQSVFGKSWQAAGRADQVREKGQFFTADVAGAPIVLVRGQDGELRGFYNVCRHHAAAVVTETQGCAERFRCPYHGWTYGTDGTLKGMVEFDGVCDFDRAKNGLVPVRVDTWENFVFVNLDAGAGSLREFLGSVPKQMASLELAGKMHFFERRVYRLSCNWKVYVDNYLDGGYHVPHAHKGLSSVIEYTEYKIENFERAGVHAIEPPGSGRGLRCGCIRDAPGARVLFVDLSELYDQCVRRRDGHESRGAAGRGPLRGDLRLLFREHGGIRAGAQRGEHRRKRKGSGRGYGTVRVRAAGSRLARLPGGAAFGATRGGRTSFPPPAARRLDTALHAARFRNLKHKKGCAPGIGAHPLGFG